MSPWLMDLQGHSKSYLSTLISNISISIIKNVTILNIFSTTYGPFVFDTLQVYLSTLGGI